MIMRNKWTFKNFEHLNVSQKSCKVTEKFPV